VCRESWVISTFCLNKLLAVVVAWETDSNRCADLCMAAPLGAHLMKYELCFWHWIVDGG
jgi:hypothetical protein